MTIKKPEDVRRKEILDAALRCFSMKGYHETRIDDIVMELEITKGAVYWHFKSKREIFISIIDQKLQEDKALWEKLLEDYEIGPEFLVKGGLLYLEHYLNDRWASPFMAEAVSESYRDKTIRIKIYEVHKEFQEMIKDALDRAIREGNLKDCDSECISLSLIAVVEGLMNQCWISGRKIDYKKIWNAFAKALLEGIQNTAKEK